MTGDNAGARWRLKRRADQRQASAAKYAEFRQWLDFLKLETGCIDCGFSTHPAALEFDHRDPSEKWFVVSSGASRSRAVVFDEIAKCDIRCANCHAIRTAESGAGGRGRPRHDRDQGTLGV